MKEAISLINSTKSKDGYSELSEGVLQLRLVALSDPNREKSISELLISIKDETAINFDTYVQNEVNTIKQEISQSEETIEFTEQYQTGISHLNDLKFIALNIGANATKLEKAILEIEKDLNKKTGALKLFGDGEQGMMKYAVLDYVKMIAKNPKSINVIRAGSQKNLQRE